MTTLCVCDLPESEIIELQTHPRTVIRDALKATCDRLHLGELHTNTVLDMTLQERTRSGLSNAAAVEYGFRLAESIAHKLKARREQLGIPTNGSVA